MIYPQPASLSLSPLYIKIVLVIHYHMLQVTIINLLLLQLLALRKMAKGPKLRLSFLNSIQICRPNDPSTLVKTPLPALTYFPSKAQDISLPTFPDPPPPHHKRNLHSSNTTQHQSQPCIMHETKSSRNDNFSTRAYPRTKREDKEKLYHSPSSSSDMKKKLTKKPKAKDDDNLTSPPSFKNSCTTQTEEEPLIRSEKTVRQTSVRTRRFKRYGSKDWKDGSTAQLENEPSENLVSRRPVRGTVDGHENQSFVVVKRSVDPYQDFKKSILEMILERHIFEPKDLEQLLMSFLSLNSRIHHKAILKAFSEIWKEVYSGPSN